MQGERLSDKGFHNPIGAFRRKVDYKNETPASNISENNEAAQLGHSQADALKEPDPKRQSQKGIQSPTKTEIPKKRGRPRKSVGTVRPLPPFSDS